MRFLFLILILLTIVIIIIGRLKSDKPSVKHEVAYKEQFYSGLSQKPDQNILEQEVRTRMIEDQLVLAYAQKQGIIVSDNDVEKRLEELSVRFGSKEKYLKDIKERYGIEKEAYLEKLTIEILRMKVQEQVKKPLIEWLLEEKKKAGLE